MKVLVACEFSGVVRDAYARRSHDAWSCDLLPTERPGNHIQGDARDVLDQGWDLLIAHPPCTDLAVSGARWMREKGEQRIRQSLELFLAFLNAPVHMICVENPVGIVGRLVRPPTQVIQPWKFGHSEQKTTCLWLKNLLPLRPTKIVSKGEFVVYGKTRLPKWYDDAWKGPKSERAKIRSRTFEGVAEAMATQWDRKRTVGFGLYPEARIRGDIFKKG